MRDPLFAEIFKHVKLIRAHAKEHPSNPQTRSCHSLAQGGPSAKTRHEGTSNPNLELLHQLHEQGVELFDCGQSLHSKGAQPEDVAVFVDTAVSALTVVVNLQSDVYAHIPLNK